MKVFIADGSKFGLRRILALLNDIKHFELVGYSADVFGAVVSIRATKPEVVILDLEMRGDTGIRVLKTIKEELPSITFIIVTNFSSDQYRNRCKELGAEFFFDKSAEFQKIPETIKHLAEGLPLNSLSKN